MIHRTAVFGYGQIAAGYRKDAKMASAISYPTHMSVLQVHPAFDVVAVVDPDPAAQAAATEHGTGIVVANASDLPADLGLDLAVLATPPAGRTKTLESLTGLKAVFVEKPLGVGTRESEEFASLCRNRNLRVQVNYLRRGDMTLRRLATEDRAEYLGDIQTVFGLYGRGAFNTATHMVDTLRLLAGEIAWVRAADEVRNAPDAALTGDVALAFSVGLQDGGIAMFAPINYDHFREAGLDIWGAHGRVSILQEGLTITHYPRQENRGLEATHEIASDQPEALKPGLGNALYHLYDNLDRAIQDQESLWSDLDSAITTESIIHAAIRSSETGGGKIELPS